MCVYIYISFTVLYMKICVTMYESFSHLGNCTFWRCPTIYKHTVV